MPAAGHGCWIGAVWGTLEEHIWAAPPCSSAGTLVRAGWLHGGAETSPRTQHMPSAALLLPTPSLPQYVCKRVSAQVLSGLPEENFSTDEQRSDGLLQHLWVWR